MVAGLFLVRGAPALETILLLFRFIFQGILQSFKRRTQEYLKLQIHQESAIKSHTEHKYSSLKSHDKCYVIYKTI